MAFTITVKNKDIDIKFNYKMMFLANRKLSQIDKDGNNSKNGAALLFQRIAVDQDEEAIHDLINLAKGGKGFTESDLIEAVGNHLEEHGYEDTFNEIKQEMLDSDFFVKKVQKYIEQMEMGADLMEDKDDQETQSQIKAIQIIIGKLKKAIS